MAEPQASPAAPSRAASLETLVQAVRADPRNSAAFHRLGLAFLRQGQAGGRQGGGGRLQLRQRALQCFSKAVNLDPEARGDAGEAGVRLLLADPELSQGPEDPAGAGAGRQRQRAMQLCSQALSLSPRAFWAWRLLGLLQMDLGQLEEAVESLQNAIKGFERDIFLWQALALCYQRLGRLTAAMKAHSKAVSLYSEPTSSGSTSEAARTGPSQAASQGEPSLGPGSAESQGGPQKPLRRRQREREAAHFCRMQMGTLSLVQAEAGESVESFRAVLAEQVCLGKTGGSSDGATSTGLPEPGQSAALGAWPDLGGLAGEARGAAASALWGYATALLARSCQVGTQGGLPWASCLLQEAATAAEAVTRACPNSALALRLQGHVGRCRQSFRGLTAAAPASPEASAGLGEPPQPSAASPAGAPGWRKGPVAYRRYLHLNPGSVHAWADAATSSSVATAMDVASQDDQAPPQLQSGCAREAQGIPAMRLALGAVASALATARGEAQAHRDSDAAGASRDLGQFPEAELASARPEGYSIGHSEGAPRMLLAHAWSILADTCLAHSTSAGGENQAEQPKKEGSGPPQPSDEASQVLPFLVLHACASAAAARPQSARPWLTVAQLCLLPQTLAALGPPPGQAPGSGPREGEAQLVAAAEEAVAKARVADPALAAPWALAALVKLRSWERGLAGPGVLREAWEDALLAVKSQAPGAATRILLGVLAAHLHRLDSAEAHVALSQLITLPDSPSPLTRPPPAAITAYSPGNVSPAASAFFLLGASFLRRAGWPQATACLEQALVLLRSRDGQEGQRPAAQALLLSTLQLLGVARVMRVLNASAYVREPLSSGAAEFQAAAAIQDESSWDAAPLLFYALALLIACTRDEPHNRAPGDPRAQQLKALELCQAAHVRVLSQAPSAQQLPGKPEEVQASDSPVARRVSSAQACALRLQCALLCSLQGPAAALQHVLSVWAPRWTAAGMPGPTPAPPEVALAALAAAVLAGARIGSAGAGQGEAWAQCQRSFTGALALCQASLGAPRHPSFPRAAQPWEQRRGDHIPRMLCLEALFVSLQSSARKQGGPRGQGRLASSPLTAKLLRAHHMFPDSLSIRYRLSDCLAQSGSATSEARHLLLLPRLQPSTQQREQPRVEAPLGPAHSMPSTEGAEQGLGAPAASLALAQSMAHAAVNASLACHCCAAGIPHSALEGGAAASKACGSTLRLLQRLVHTHPADASLRAMLLLRATSAEPVSAAAVGRTKGTPPAQVGIPDRQGEAEGEAETRTEARKGPSRGEDGAVPVSWGAPGAPPDCARATALLRSASSLATLLTPSLELSAELPVSGLLPPEAADSARALATGVPGAGSALEPVLAPLWGLRQLGCCCTSGYPPKLPGGTAAQSFLSGRHSAACSARAALAALCLLAASECLLGIPPGQDGASDASSSPASDLALAALHLLKRFPMSPGSGPGLQPCAALQHWRCFSWALHRQADQGSLAAGPALVQRLMSAAQETAGAVEAALGGGAGPAGEAAGAAAAAAGVQSIGLQWNSSHARALRPLAGRLLELLESAAAAARAAPLAATLRVSQASLALRSSEGPGATMGPLLALEDALEQLRSEAPQGPGLLGPALFMHGALSLMQYKDPESGSDKSALLAARRSLVEALEAEGPGGSLQGVALLLCQVESDLAGSARAAARRSAAQAEQELACWMQAPGGAQKASGGSPGVPSATGAGPSQDAAAEGAAMRRGGLMMPPDTALASGAALLRGFQADGRGAQGQEGKAQPPSSAPPRQPRGADQSQKPRSAGAAGASGPKQQPAQGQQQQQQSLEAGAGGPGWSPKELSVLTRRALHLWPACTPLRDLLAQTQTLSGAA